MKDQQPTKPKSAEELAASFPILLVGIGGKKYELERYHAFIKSIQLDATKAALRRAAEEANKHYNVFDAMRAINTLADNLKDVSEL